MLYQEYLKWLNTNCPPSLPFDDFKDFCAMCGALTLQNTMNADGLTIHELIERLFDKPRSLS